MSSDPNMPDFDSMSQEEMMAWMESLAKRQGADESGFLTSADVEIDEVDPDSVDESIRNQEYRPEGWTEERWQAQLAKEKAEKEARQSAKQTAESAQPAVPEPIVEPEPTPAVAEQAVNADGTPDFDSMSPEEMMEWMESLAKRQGAEEGFTTAAKMNVAEIDPSTVDEAVLKQDYRPEGWTEERWQAQLAKEKAEKEARQSAKQKAVPAPEEEPDFELEYTDDSEVYEEYDDYELIDDEDEELATLNLDDLPTIDINEEETQVASSNPMSWLENLAASDEDSEELDLPDLASLAEDMSGLEALAQQDAASDPMDWLANLAGDVDEEAPELDLEDMSAGLEGLEAFAFSSDEVDEDEESLLSIHDVEDPVSFLETLAGLEGAPEEELSTDANATIPDLPGFMVDDDEDEDEEELVLDDILEDTQPSEELELAWDSEDPNSIENPEAWLDALAQSSSADAEQMSMFDEDFDGEDEDEELPVVEDHDSRVLDALHSGENVSPEDIERFFVNQFKKAEQFADLDEDFSEEVEDEEIEPAVSVDVPDWLQELGVGTPPTQAVAADDEDEDEEDLMADVLAGIDGDDEEIAIPGVLAGLDIDSDLEEMDMPDWGDDYSDDDDEAEQVGIPDWLMEADEAEEVGIPDWLKQGAEDDTGDVVADIIAQDATDDVIADIIADELDIAPGETTVIATESGQKVEVDPNDTWTQAFLMEDREEDAEAWYNQRLTEITGQMTAIDTDEDVPASAEPVAQPITSPSAGITLQPASLPVEEELPEGQPETAPAWLTGQESAVAFQTEPDLQLVTEDAADDIPSWLEDSISDDDNIEIPDWLTEDEFSEDPIPDWLSEAGGSDIEPAAIPSWLTDTVEESSDIVAQVVEPEPIKQAPPTAIVPQAHPAANVAAAIKSAQEKVAANQLDEALQDYESVVRANESVDVVVTDLQKLTNNEVHKKNPAVYRVLGDALMRRGDLQDALDTYRRALNLL